MAEGLLRRLFAQAGVGASVGSAGLLPGGAPATPDAIATMADRRVDIAPHVSQTVTEEMARDTPLILAMTRHHVRELCAGYGAPIDRTFTVKELVRRGDELGGRVHGESVYAWLARLNAGRRTADLMGDDPADDIADPVGQPRAVYENTADELEDQLRRFVQLLVGGPPRSAAYSDGDRVQRPANGRPDERDEYAGDPSFRY
jgi:low molecular weight protein-tyrosine phosphatase